MKANKRRTAIHEAGHVVAMLRHCVEYGYATIAQDDDSAGHVLTHGKADNPADAQGKAIGFCGGYAACLAAGYPEAQAIAGCGHDFNLASEIIDFWQLGSLADWQAKAVEFMRKPENVHAGDLIAKHLLQHSTLDTDYLKVLLGVADEGTPEAWAGFERYLALRRSTHN